MCAARRTTEGRRYFAPRQEDYPLTLILAGGGTRAAISFFGGRIGSTIAWAPASVGGGGAGAAARQRDRTQAWVGSVPATAWAACETRPAAIMNGIPSSGGAARAWRPRPAPKSVLDCPRSARPGAADLPGEAFAARRHTRRRRSTRPSRRRYSQPSPPPNAPNPLSRVGFRYRPDSTSPHRPEERVIHPMQYAVLHWISVISSWVEFLAAAVGGGRNRHLL